MPLFAFLISFLIIPIIIKLAFRFNILDIPAERKVHDKPTPKLGGIAVFIGFITVVLISGIPLSRGMIAIIIASSLMFICGVADDVFHLRERTRLAYQIISVIILMLSGVYVKILPLDYVLGPAVNFVLTFFWIVGIVNAFNFLDGINGEASGIGIIIGITLAIFAFSSNNITLGVVIIIVIGAICGFIPFNLRYKARIFLGDSGSTFLGFFLSSSSIYIEWGEMPSITNLIMPVIIFSICIYDMTLTTVTRIYTGKVKNFDEWLSWTGKDHIHHRLSEIFGGDRLTAVLFIYIITANSTIFPSLFAIYKGTSDWFVAAALLQTILVYAIVTLLLWRIR
ncbi:MAG: undecaprenyl/decaprenyl-phosphate alpha-N-acetylglucosaminyl 1-phosphate transferase [Deltaproteobacteria bacterium]|nr:undecaprenyl/decaprenyl-phosphate alpha-N-acetylglucosaminyl 1-phosphate transferase [Deltaproteobacteria bacterium]